MVHHTTSRDRVQDAKASLRGAVQQKRKNASSQCSASRRALLPQAHKNSLDYRLGGLSSPASAFAADWPLGPPGSGWLRGDSFFSSRLSSTGGRPVRARLLRRESGGDSGPSAPGIELVSLCASLSSA